VFRDKQQVIGREVMSPKLKVEHIRKAFPGVVAVNDVSFELGEGEVLALLGENGAGKSTLTKIICGALKPDEGRIIIDGKEQSFDSSYDAMKAGVGMVYQELSMVGSMTVAENIFMNRQPVNKLGNIRWRELYANTEAILKKFELNISPRTLVKTLSVGTQQLLEILKALSFNPKVIILDEPTSSLTDTEIELLFRIIQNLKSEGYSFIYITHKISEVFRIADRVIVMRDGRYIGCKLIDEVTERDIVTMMVGREIRDLYGKEHRSRRISEEYLFEAEDITAAGLYEHISFGVRRGEIVGFAGLIGSGRTEMALGLVGAHRVDSGVTRMHGKAINILTPSDAIRNKIAYLTEDRKKYGLYLRSSVKANVIAPKLRSFSRYGFMKRKSVTEYAIGEVKKYSIATPSVDQKVINLSGGNQQKTLISMWMGIEPELLIIDEPTRGVDVGAKAEIYKNIKAFADQGNGVVVISSELPELIGICDRIFVMHKGQIRGELNKEEFSEDVIMEMATGINTNHKQGSQCNEQR
jgi:ABC-type sugar transport system ATPase subunit